MTGTFRALHCITGIGGIKVTAFSMAVIDNNGITVFRQGFPPADHPDHPDARIFFKGERV